MTFAYWCIFIAMFLPLIWAGISKIGATDYDNSNPRVWMAKQEGRAQRANAAQQNSYEAFPPFAAAVVVAQLTDPSQMTINILAGAFILMRIAYGFFYITDKPLLRSSSWGIGFAMTIALFVT
ncbi:MAG: hypothetical protein GY727_13435 [Gammaproteobacteria bacterium]|nr:hypothetical protein [Gammaproteobacteria bacterium]MCP4088288.1 hypothetical protein [Gammaproteobacteria bacterium]MCP4276401.1 hypothetical protein [Gammaproteobacteria bacterium]MCP4831048.1 hypothetical protein [Gammaproteobacteria bacterium]MCP4927431.1 hypothetical protein [Gammaproteobacteria bacterium]